MKTIARHHATSVERRAQWSGVAIVSFASLLLLAAAVDRRIAIVDRASGELQRVERQGMPLSTEDMIREMLTHD